LLEFIVKILFLRIDCSFAGVPFGDALLPFTVGVCGV
jgi:hypothetical protein